ncbi:MAG: chemotaxis protein CheD [Leptospira sp.]|nr:chemotaxis protein CheD [Leptospira sp.]
MDSPNFVTDIFLNPGEIYFGEKNIRLRTLLGSCVSIVLWCPGKKMGGMCHYLLPDTQENKSDPNKSTRYGIHAIDYFFHEMKKVRLERRDFIAKVFGGSTMFLKEEESLFDSESSIKQIGNKNVDFAKKILQENEIKILSEDTGGTQSRKIFFTIWDGEVWVEKK